jgi:hypothetical protein
MKEIRWAENVARLGVKGNAARVLVGMPAGKNTYKT